MRVEKVREEVKEEEVVEGGKVKVEGVREEEQVREEKEEEEKVRVERASCQPSPSPTAEDQNHHPVGPTSKSNGNILIKHSEDEHSLFGENLPPNKLHQQ